MNCDLCGTSIHKDGELHPFKCRAGTVGVCAKCLRTTKNLVSADTRGHTIYISREAPPVLQTPSSKERKIRCIVSLQDHEIVDLRSQGRKVLELTGPDQVAVSHIAP